MDQNIGQLGSEREGDLPKVIGQGSGRVSIQPPICPAFFFFLYCTTNTGSVSWGFQNLSLVKGMI